MMKWQGKFLWHPIGVLVAGLLLSGCVDDLFESDSSSSGSSRSGPDIQRVANQMQGDISIGTLSHQYATTRNGFYFRVRDNDAGTDHVAFIENSATQWTQVANYPGVVWTLAAKHNQGVNSGFLDNPYVLATSSGTTRALYSGLADEIWSGDDHFRWNNLQRIAVQDTNSPQVYGMDGHKAIYRTNLTGQTTGTLQEVTGDVLPDSTSTVWSNFQLVSTQDYVWAYGGNHLINLTEDRGWVFDVGNVYHVLHDSWSAARNELWIRAGNQIWRFNGDELLRIVDALPDTYNNQPINLIPSATHMAHTSAYVFLNGGLAIRKVGGRLCNYMPGDMPDPTSDAFALRQTFMTSGVMHASQRHIYTVHNDTDGEQIIALHLSAREPVCD